MPHDLPPFEPRAPWWGPDLQTLRNVLRAPRSAPGDAVARRLELALADGSGDRLAALHEPATDAGGRPLVVLIHGLGGSEDSIYVRASSTLLRARGHPVLRLNLRGAGPSRPLCRLQYHAGLTLDLRDALAALDPALLARGLLLVGYSLGGNMLLKFLAEHGGELPVLGAVSVSAPIDLQASARRFHALRNRLYLWNVLHAMKRDSLAPGAELTAEEERRIRAARSIVEYDDTFIAPRNGYSGADAYYAANSARRFLAAIPVPTLVVHALDDPWIPASCYRAVAWERNPNLLPLLPARGGHVGFHGRGSRVPWHDRAIERFFDDLCGREGVSGTGG